MDQPIPDVTRADVERIVQRDFSPEDRSAALGVLAEYSGIGEPHRVHLAILKMSYGDLAKLREWITTAQQDFRDVLAAAEYPLAFSRWSALNQAPEAERRSIYDADWHQYSQWLMRP